MKRRWMILVALLLALGFIFTQGPAGAVAPPQPACGVCTEYLDSVAQERDVFIDRGRSSMTIQAFENGSSRWTAQVHLQAGSEALRNDTLRREIVQDVDYTVVSDRKDLQTRIDGETLVVTYRGEETSHQTLGIYRFTAFDVNNSPPFTSGGEGTPYPGADTLRLRAPEGYQVVGTYGNETNDTTVVWNGNSHEQFAGHIDRDTVVSFAKVDSRAPFLRAWLADILDSLSGEFSG